MTALGTPDAGSMTTASMAPSGRRFEVPAGRTLLLAALDAGIALPHSCRNGTCRACLRPLLAGTVDYGVEWPGLLPEERASGAWVLPCVAFPRTDVVLGD